MKMRKRKKKRENSSEKRKRKRKAKKGVWWMPRLSEAKKDVISCEKPRRGANTLRPVDIRMGEPPYRSIGITAKQ